MDITCPVFTLTVTPRQRRRLYRTMSVEIACVYHRADRRIGDSYEVTTTRIPTPSPFWTTRIPVPGPLWLTRTPVTLCPGIPATEIIAPTDGALGVPLDSISNPVPPPLFSTFRPMFPDWAFSFITAAFHFRAKGRQRTSPKASNTTPIPKSGRAKSGNRPGPTPMTSPPPTVKRIARIASRRLFLPISYLWAETATESIGFADPGSPPLKVFNRVASVERA